MASIIGTVQHSEVKEITYQRTWKIRDFPRLMRLANEDFCLDAEMIQILLPDSSTWSWQLTCYPNSVDRAEIRLELDRLSTFEGELNTAIAVRLLKKGKDKGKTLLKRRHTFSRRGEDGSWLELAAPHHVLKKSADILMPEGILTIFVEIKILPSKQTTVNSRLRAFQPSIPWLKPDSKAQPSIPRLKPDSKAQPSIPRLKPDSKAQPSSLRLKPDSKAQPSSLRLKPDSKAQPSSIRLKPDSKAQPSSLRLKPDSKAQPSSLRLKPDSKEDIMASMLLDSHVDLGPSLVQLVFRDSKLLCHTFPLAARLAVQGRVADPDPYPDPHGSALI
jgi:hypothetical protein